MAERQEDAMAMFKRGGLRFNYPSERADYKDQLVMSLNDIMTMIDDIGSEEIAIDICINLEGSLLPKHQACIWVSTAKEFHNHLRNTPNIEELSCTLLLTETDEMIARGSKPDLLALSQYLSKQCQVLIYASRVTKSINSISRSLQHNPKRYKLNTNIIPNDVLENTYRVKTT